MTWLQRYRLTHYVGSSFWILPALGIVVALVTVRYLHSIEVAMGWQTAVDPSTALTLLGTLAASMFSFIVFVCSALLICVQLASAQLTPRYISIVLQTPATKLSLMVFVYTFTLTLAALVRIQGGVPLLTAYAAVYSCLASLCFFLYLVDKVCKTLRPSGALEIVSRLGHEVIKDSYPRRLAAPQAPPPEPAEFLDREPRCTIPNLRDGVVLAFHMEGLVSLAQRANCLIEMVPQVGDFVAAEQPLFRIFGDGAPPAAALYQLVALGAERTSQQDPAFAFRIMVDIASKALSPAINDPTTAVLAIDQIHYLLRHVGTRHLQEGHRRDARGSVRLVYRTPDWEDFVQLAVTEVRHFGGTSIQVVRRLRGMLENLIQTLPAERAGELRQELDLLNRSAKRVFPDAEDRAMADIGDLQGVGGKAPAGTVLAGDLKSAVAGPNAHLKAQL
jgi:uncharacterized membrane protein